MEVIFVIESCFVDELPSSVDIIYNMNFIHYVFNCQNIPIVKCRGTLHESLTHKLLMAFFPLPSFSFHPPPFSVLGMTLHSIWWCSSILGIWGMWTIPSLPSLGGWGCRILWLHLCRGVRLFFPSPTMRVSDMTLNNLMVRLL